MCQFKPIPLDVFCDKFQFGVVYDLTLYQKGFRTTVEARPSDRFSRLQSVLSRSERDI